MEESKAMAAELTAAIIKARQSVPGVRITPGGAAGIYFEILDAIEAELKRRSGQTEKPGGAGLTQRD
jgi:hypothetical protein